MKILLDAMGGDNAPKSTVQGAADAVKEFGDGMTLALLGDEAKIKAAAQELGVDLTPFELIHWSRLCATKRIPAWSRA